MRSPDRRFSGRLGTSVSAAEDRHLLTQQLLQADGPLTRVELARRAGLTATVAGRALRDLVDAGQVVEADGGFRWAARQRDDDARHGRTQRRALAADLAALEPRFGDDADVDDEPAARFHAYVTGDYRPPADKPWLLLVQCAVRRPFSSAPSHASIRRAVAAATGADPGTDPDSSPVHVVVLASRVGPVPYDLQDLYPASIRAEGVKRLSPADYGRVRPILVERMADYLRAHGDRYRRVVAFGEGRYGDILRAAAEASECAFPVLPTADGRRLTRLGRSTPRKYWEKYWIQLFDELRAGLAVDEAVVADRRLADLDPEIEG